MPHDILWILVFSAKDLFEIRTGSVVTPSGGGEAKAEVGQFVQITHCILKMVQDRWIVSIKDDWEVVCTPYTCDYICIFLATAFADSCRR